MAIFIHEFLYRGRPEGSAEPPAWHLTLASVAENDFGEPVRSERTLNMAQAKEAGWGLPEIIAAINLDLMSEIEEKRTAVASLEAKLEAAAEREQALLAESASAGAQVPSPGKVVS